MRYFFVQPEEIAARPVVISGTDANHIRTVLRSRPGDIIGLLDGQGRAYRAEIVNIDRQGVAVDIISELPVDAPPPVRLIVAQAYLKDRKMDRLVRRLCELGMAEWRPFISARSVARPPRKRMTSRLERWQSIAREAVKQCRRADLPIIHPCVAYDSLLTESADCSRRLLFWEETPRPLAWPAFRRGDRPAEDVMVVLGPEGGFTRDEVDKAREHGFTIAGLGPRVLQADTAALAAATIVQFVFGDMGPKTY